MLSSLASASLLVGCSNDPASSSPAADAGAFLASDAMAQVPIPNVDAQPDAAQIADLTGTWRDYVMTGPTYDIYQLQIFEDGDFRVDRRREDGFGAYINCILIEQWTGTWTIDGVSLLMNPATGTTQRADDIGGLGCDSEDLYDERPMTTEEIGNHNYLGGTFALEDERLSVTTSAWTWTWDRVE